VPGIATTVLCAFLLHSRPDLGCGQGL